MRLIRHLNEAKSFNALLKAARAKEAAIDIMPYLDTLEKECSRILKVYQQADDFLYRGIKGVGEFVAKKGRTKVRIPRNTDVEFHRYLNKVFKDKFGWKVRDGISTTSSWSQASFYGNVYIFFPTDKYKFAWSPKYGDLYANFKILHTSGIDIKEFLKKKEKTFVRAVNTFTDSDADLVKAIKSDKRHNEVMFKVGKYYMLERSNRAEDDLRIALGMGPEK